MGAEHAPSLPHTTLQVQPGVFLVIRQAIEVEVHITPVLMLVQHQR